MTRPGVRSSNHRPKWGRLAFATRGGTGGEPGSPEADSAGDIEGPLRSFRRELALQPFRPVADDGARSLAPTVEEHNLGQRTATNRSVVPSRPTHDGVPGEHPIVGNPDRSTKQWLAAVRRPTREACPEAEGACGQEEVLHRGEDGTSKEEL